MICLWTQIRGGWILVPVLQVLLVLLVLRVRLRSFRSDRVPQVRRQRLNHSAPRGPEGLAPRNLEDRRTSGPYVLTLSRIDAKKGIDVLIRAWHGLASAGRLGPWSLRIAGDGDPRYVAEIRALAEDGPGANRVRFTGWVGGAERRQLLRDADL